MNLNYTCGLEREIWSMAEELNDNADFSIAIDFLNSKENFQPFGARLAAFIANKLSLPSTDSKSVITALSEQCEKNGVVVSEIGSPNTLRNWFEKDTRPIKGRLASRRSMFALAFAIKLSVDETKDLFHKIYLDRAFNYRDEKEVIYYFCLKNNKSWTDAGRLISNAGDLSKDDTDHTQYTKAISSSVDSFQAEQDLLDYIRQNSHNFKNKSVTASEMLKRYLTDAKKWVREETIHYGLDHKNQHIESNNYMFETITGLKVTGNKGTKTIFNNTSLPHEIENRFPEAGTISKKDKNSEEYRKVIVLLSSYCFWYQIQNSQADYEFYDYVAQLDNELCECNYPELYYGNPFDWMFMCCTYSSLQEGLDLYFHRPLDLFRDLMDEVIN